MFTEKGLKAAALSAALLGTAVAGRAYPTEAFVSSLAEGREKIAGAVERAKDVGAARPGIVYEGAYARKSGQRFLVRVTVPAAPANRTAPLTISRTHEPAHPVTVCDKEKEVGWGDGPIMECVASHVVQAPEYDTCVNRFDAAFGDALVQVFALTAGGETLYAQASMPLAFETYYGYQGGAGPKNLCAPVVAEGPLPAVPAPSVRRTSIKQNASADRSNLVLDVTFGLDLAGSRVEPGAGDQAKVLFGNGGVRIDEFYWYASGTLNGTAADVKSYDHFEDGGKIEFRRK